MYHRESSDKWATSEPEVSDCRYSKLREEIETSAKPAMFHHSVRTPSLLVRVRIMSRGGGLTLECEIESQQERG